MQTLAQQAGIIAPTVPAERGGLGLDPRACAVALEESGCSLLGPTALNCAAPDEGNIARLAKVANNARQEHYPQPLCSGAHAPQDRLAIAGIHKALALNLAGSERLQASCHHLVERDHPGRQQARHFR